MRNKRSLALVGFGLMLALASTAQAQIALPEGLTGHFTTMGTVILTGVAAVALAAFGMKVVPMALKFFKRVWAAIAGS